MFRSHRSVTLDIIHHYSTLRPSDDMLRLYITRNTTWSMINIDQPAFVTFIHIP